jgi:hypothetical protein
MLRVTDRTVLLGKVMDDNEFVAVSPFKGKILVPGASEMKNTKATEGEGSK